MPPKSDALKFDCQKIAAVFLDPYGEPTERLIEVRTHPITGRTCRITYSRSGEREPGACELPAPPPDAGHTAQCPFCRPQVAERTPGLIPELSPFPRMQRSDSLLFPNLYPYGAYSAVSLFDDRHFVEIGTASAQSYADCFINCADYLARVLAYDSEAAFQAVTQNHLPSAGGSLVHPHLQVQADRHPSNYQRFLQQRAVAYRAATGKRIFSAYLDHERKDGARYIGRTNDWEWLAAFAPEGFYEIWGVLPGVCSIREVGEARWAGLAIGVLNAQRFYRHLCRNGYNLGLLSVETAESGLELRIVIVVRANYAPWVRNDFSGFEVMLGDMATFDAPEETAEMARPFWAAD